MRGTSSIAKDVIQPSRRAATTSSDEEVGRNETVAVPCRSRLITEVSSGLTETTTSAPCHGSLTTCAPAST